MVTVSVVVPARDATATLPALLAALDRQVLQPSEVLVVDDGGMAAFTDLRGPGRGSYAARNVGLAAATGDVVAFTDADCEPDEHWLARAVVHVADDVVVGGGIRQRVREGASVWEVYDRGTYLDQGELVAQGFAATANLLARTAVLRDLGGFDETLRSSGDLALGARLRAAGISVVHVPEAFVHHQPRTTAAEVWALHRRLGAGWRDAHHRGLTPAWWQEPALRVPLGRAVELTGLRRRQVAPVHALAMAARWRGRLLG